MMQRKSFVPVTWIAGSHSPRPEDISRRAEFIRTRKSRAKQRVEEEFPPIELKIK